MFVKYVDGVLHGNDGKPLYIVGVNYVTCYVCTNFWEDWRPDHIRADLKNIASMGLNAVRVPMPWGFMEPCPGQYNEVFQARFRLFVDWCGALSLYVMPWFLVGIATQAYDVPYRNGLSFFGPEMTELAENHLRHFISPYRDEQWILFWDICDEPEFMDLCGPGPDKPPYDRRLLRRWARDCYNAVKSADENHLITLGYGPIATDNNGIHIRDAVDQMDVLAVTAYPGVISEAVDRMRSNYFLPYNTRFSALGKPVFCCEAPGHSNVFFSEEVLCRYFRTSFYSSLLAGSTGFMPWVYTDFDASICHEVPLEGATGEPFFGLCRADGSPKARGLETAAFAAFAKQVGLAEYRPPPSKAAILVSPDYYGRRPPANSRTIDLVDRPWDIDRTAFRKTYACYLMAQTAIGNVSFAWPDTTLEGYELIVAPSPRGITTSQWARLAAYVEAGGTLVVEHEDRWGLCAYTNDLFGFTAEASERDYGYDRMEIRQPLGALKSGKTLPFAGPGIEVLRVTPISCRVTASFPDGTPAMTLQEHGKGRALYLCKNVEDGLLDVPYEVFLQKASFPLYRALAELAGCANPYACQDPRVETGILTGPRDSLLICVNHDTAAVTSSVFLPEGSIVTHLDGTAAEAENGRLPVPLAGCGVGVYRVRKDG